MSNPQTFVSNEIRERIRHSLGDCTIYYVTHGRVLVACPDPKKWSIYGMGYLIVAKSREGNGQIILLDTEGLIPLLVHEMYKKFSQNLSSLSSDFICFPSELCTIGIQFRSSSDAKGFVKEVDSISPDSSFSFRSIFRKKKLPISAPHEVVHQSGAKWNPDKGFEVDSQPVSTEQICSILSDSTK